MLEKFCQEQDCILEIPENSEDNMLTKFSKMLIQSKDDKQNW